MQDLGLRQANFFSMLSRFHSLLIHRENLRKGVIRDQERQHQRKIENTLRLQKQSDLTKVLREKQDTNLRE